MNSRSGGNETNLVNFSADLTTLNQLETKESLLSIPFDHIYACHSDSADRRVLQLEKEVEIASHCVVTEDKSVVAATDVSQITKRLAAAEAQNKRLKDLLIYHLDLIQQQNTLFTKREKIYQNIKQENDSLKSIINERDSTAPPARHTVNPNLVHSLVTTSTVTSTVVSNSTDGPSEIMLNSFTEFLLPCGTNDSFIFDDDLTKTKPFDSDFGLPSAPDADVSSFMPAELPPPPILDTKLGCDKFAMIDSKRSYVKKEPKTEPRSGALYTVTSNSGNPVIQRIQRNRRAPATGIGSLSRMAKSTVKVDPPETSQPFEQERTYSINRKPKMISTYGKARGGIAKKTTQFTGSLSDRLRLIDTTPTGEDPYQLGEADMREQSPIPKLMLQKTNQGRMKVSKDTGIATNRRIYDAPATETTTKSKLKMNRYITNSYTTIKKESPKSLLVDDPEIDIVKTEPSIDWRSFGAPKPRTETSLCDFSYGETSNNLATNILPSLDFQELFSSENLSLDALNPIDFTPVVIPPPPPKPRKRGGRTSSALVHTPLSHLDVGQSVGAKVPPNAEVKRGGESKRGRKRAHSTTVLAKPPKPKPPPKPKAPKGKAACRGKKSPVPGMMTQKPYHSQVGDPDLSWYLGLDPDLKSEDVDPPADCKRPTVEVAHASHAGATSCGASEATAAYRVVGAAGGVLCVAPPSAGYSIYRDHGYAACYCLRGSDT
ncbi:uncharacterized protein [Battus philenor]|uniref:uncharacterized protein isoform X2 n=1 Tax=Battus philenor TaxID=42288 RepID=UPI0035D07141